ncbi:Regulator of RNase E activity RraA [Rhizobiales bacterium GAS113]|jgi:4-hydroxy-4-methyl-2-oxoglutarate aldolase|nr:Regulator of RNase E activity RraA [Rhizobiales bacterium GAS113]
MLKRGDSGFLDELRKHLYCAVLSDVLDEVGFRDQAMAARIRPLDDQLVMAGFARTGLFREVFHVAPGENPYELEIKIIDDLKPGDIVVFGCGGSERIAPWGELLTTAARARGAVGAVTDGFVRDVRAIRNASFPVFHGGIAPLDSKGRGKVAEIDVPIACAGVHIEPGDLVFGDVDGVVVVPRRVEEQVLARAFEKVSGENATRDELLRGAKLKDVFDRFGVL